MSFVERIDEMNEARIAIKDALIDAGLDLRAVPFAEYGAKIEESALMIPTLENSIFKELGKNNAQVFNLTIDVSSRVKMVVAWGDADADAGLTKDVIKLNGVVGGVTIPLTEENGDFFVIGSDTSHTKIWINNNALNDANFGYIQLQSDLAYQGARAKVYVFI